LQVGVHDDDGLSGGRIHSGCDRDLMTEVARQTDIAETWILPSKRLQDNGSAIGAAVISKDGFGKVRRAAPSAS
jgi:hypothetical protein